MGDYTTGSDCQIDRGATVGYRYAEGSTPTELGDEVTVRSGSTVYTDVVLGDRVQTGHDVLVREYTEVGDDSIIGTKTVIDGRTVIGSQVSLQTGVYIPAETDIGDDVFIGPNAVLTNDPYPLREAVELEGPVIHDSASIGANATLLPGVEVGERAFVAAGAVVTTDVPPDTLATGVPAEFNSLPRELRGENDL